MVFKHLPVKMTHRKWNAVADASKVYADIMLVWTTLPDVQILATCRALQEEAGSILILRLKAMKNAKIHLIATPDWLRTIRFSCLEDYLEPSNFQASIQHRYARHC